MTSNDTYQPRIPSRSTFHDLRGIRYHVTEWGSATSPLLVMLHGWGDCGASFQFLVDELKGDWHVIAPDWRGFGRTQYRAPGYWFPDYLADLDELLRIYQPDEPVRLLGHSMGGNVAGLYAGVLPERVAAFVNVEGFGLPDTVPDGAPAHLRRWLEAGRTTPAFSRYRDFAELAVRIARRSPAMPADRAMFVARHWGIESADGLVELRADPAHKLPNAIQYRRAEALACWARITAPVLQVHGEETGADGDVMTWLRANAEPGLFPDAEAVTISNAGHMVHFEQPAALAGAVERFLGHPGRAVV